jgi:hypothetical protein
MPRPLSINLLRNVSAIISRDPRVPAPDISLVMKIVKGRQEIINREAHVLLTPADIDFMLANSPEAVRVIRAALARHDAAVKARAAASHLNGA